MVTSIYRNSAAVNPQCEGWKKSEGDAPTAYSMLLPGTAHLTVSSPNDQAVFYAPRLAIAGNDSAFSLQWKWYAVCG